MGSKSIYAQVILLKADINAAKLLQWRRLYTATIYMVFSLYSLLSIMSVNEPFFNEIIYKLSKY